MAARWPRSLPPLTPEQKRIADDFMNHWHTVLPRKFAAIERFNHGYPVQHAPASFTRTLEIGAGIGEHLHHERLTPEQMRHYCRSRTGVSFPSWSLPSGATLSSG